MAANRPTAITLRTYNVGFGDCFLVSFHYPDRDRHILIDYGSTSRPRPFKDDPDHMRNVAADITLVCGGKLDAVVATHRHTDHISGFGGKTGKLIADLQPDVVIQPWTEDPAAAPDAAVPVNDPGNALRAFTGALSNMNQVAGYLHQRHLEGTRKLDKQISFLGLENIRNEKAVKNLAAMGPNVFVRFGSKSGLEKILPGVATHVLGPPTLEQTESIEGYAKKSNEYWFSAVRPMSIFWATQAMQARVDSNLFPDAPTRPVEGMAEEVRWFAERASSQEERQMLGIVRRIDAAINNTSVILLFEAGGKRLLFPGDAQVETWLFALKKLEDEGKLPMVEDVDLYKVGHHGSLNATPRSLWQSFRKKDAGLQTIMSTLPGKHGSSSNDSEVPRIPLVDDLTAHSQLFSTQNMNKADGLCHIIRIDL